MPLKTKPAQLFSNPHARVVIVALIVVITVLVSHGNDHGGG